MVSYKKLYEELQAKYIKLNIKSDFFSLDENIKNIIDPKVIQVFFDKCHKSINWEVNIVVNQLDKIEESFKKYLSDQDKLEENETIGEWFWNCLNTFGFIYSESSDLMNIALDLFEK